MSLVTKSAATVQAEQLTAMREAATSAVHNSIQIVYASTTAGYPEGEKMTWDKQETAARAHLAGTATADQTASLTARATVTGETLTDLANKIVLKADQFSQLGMALAGVRSVAADAIEAATTQAEADAAVAVANASIAQILGA